LKESDTKAKAVALLKHDEIEEKKARKELKEGKDKAAKACE